MVHWLCLKSGLSHKKAHKAQMLWPVLFVLLCGLIKMNTTFEAAKPGSFLIDRNSPKINLGWQAVPVVERV
jgi:hypothetical protein